MQENTSNKGKYAFSDFILDEDTGEVYYHQERLKLAPKVFQCLSYFVKNSNRLISKDELITEIWNEAFVEDNAITYTVSQLRKVLAVSSPDITFIETVPRRGFRFTEKVTFVSSNSLELTGSRELLVDQIVEEIWIEEIETRSDLERPLRLPGKTSTTKWWFAASFIFALLVLSASAFWYYDRQTSIDPDVGRMRSVAVLPLDDLSGTGLDRSIALGLTYGLIAQLGRSDALAVRPLNSTLAAIDLHKDPIETGRALGVDAIVEWNIQRSDTQYRINARLIRVSNGLQLWNESFLYSETDLFQVQDKVSSMTANALIANLSADDRSRLQSRITENNEAYQAYLRGRFHWNRRNLEGFNTALGFFEQAITLDPKFADAHAGLADVYLGFYDYGYKAASDSIPFALAAVNRALQLDPKLANAYSTLASIEFLHNRNWKETEANFRRAIEIAPNDSTARLRFGWMLSVANRTEEGLEQLKIAEKLDPTSRIGQANIAYNLMISGRLDEAEAKLVAVSKVAVDFSLSHWYLGTVYLLKNRDDDALEQYFAAYEIDEGDGEQVAKIRSLLATQGRTKAFETWRKDLEKRYAAKYFPPSNIALIAALGRDRENTLKWLRESDRVRDPWLLQILHDPEYNFLKDDLEFQTIIDTVRSS